MGQAITDYVKFLADARDAVYRLNCDQNTAGQLADEEEMKERELETARKAVSDSVNQTIKGVWMRLIPAMTRRLEKDRNVSGRQGRNGRRPKARG